MGRIYDLWGPNLALRSMAVLPVVVAAVFSLIWLNDRARGGYQKALSADAFASAGGISVAGTDRPNAPSDSNVVDFVRRGPGAHAGS
jgi:hypothetical protein